MDYEKKYKEALERAKEIVNNEHASSVWKGWIRNCFPEFKESEDERIRKAIIEMIHDTPSIECEENYNVSKEDILAWLEKQGEKESDPRYRYLEDLLTADDIYQMSVNQAMIEEAKSKAVNALFKLEISKLLGLEKQDQQRTTDKVEPKFQNGQWIVWQNQCYKVNFLNGRGYELILQNGLITSIEYGAVDESAHLWTIEDAKVGDVLSVTMYSGMYSGVWIGIFKEYNGRTFSSYCFMNTEGIFHFGASGHGRVEAIHPATQEQRDLLLQKMKEAGYEFDFYKKELKKIE